MIGIESKQARVYVASFGGQRSRRYLSRRAAYHWLAMRIAAARYGWEEVEDWPWPGKLVDRLARWLMWRDKRRGELANR